MMLKITNILFIYLLSYSVSYTQEICNNGIDDDFDGLIDLNDTTDCDCKIGVLPLIIPNPSFESYSSCPLFNSQMSKVNFWQDALAMNSPDYFNCGYSITLISPPFPHGTGAVGFALGDNNTKEYFGTCLLDTLHAGVTYKLQFQFAQVASLSPRPIAIFGSNSCANLPYPRTPFGPFGSVTKCPSLNPNWVTLDTLVPLINNNSWNTYNFEFTPTSNLTSIIIGPSCALLSTPVSQVYYGTIDNLKLSTTSPTVTISETGHICKNNLVLTANYDSIPNSFQWYKEGVALINDTNALFSVPFQGVGSYQVVLSFNKGCLFSEIHVVDTPIINFNYDSVGTCQNTTDGKIIVKNVTGGTSPNIYAINTSTHNIDSAFNNLGPGIYSISVMDSNSCTSIKSAIIKSFPIPTSNFTSDTVCLGFPTSLIDKSSISKGYITSWKWENPINSSSQNTTYTSQNSGAFPVTLTLTSDSGCINDTTLNVLVNPLPVIDFYFDPALIFTFNTTICFSNSSIGAINYFWDFDFNGPNSFSTLVSPCPVLFPEENGDSYEVKLIGVNQFGCIDSTTKIIIIKDDFIVYVPNSFTPNNDKLNDEVSVFYQGLESLEWIIFNR